MRNGAANYLRLAEERGSGVSNLKDIKILEKNIEKVRTGSEESEKVGQEITYCVLFWWWQYKENG